MKIEKGKIAIDAKDYKKLIDEFKQNSSTIEMIAKELDRWVEHYTNHPFMEAGQPARERKVFLHSVKRSVKLINENVPEPIKPEPDGEPEEKKPIKVFSLGDLSKLEIKPVKWCVQDLIPEKSIVVLGGKRGTFKSFGAMNLSLCVASGKPFLNVFETTQTKVLYVDEENGISILKERTHKLKTGLHLNEDKNVDKNVYFTSFENIKLDNPEWREKLEKAIKKFKPSLVIIDSLRRCITGDENVAGEISRLFTDIIRPLSEKYGLTWILLHHMRKGIPGGRGARDDMDEIRGSSDIANYSDVIIIFDRKRGEADKFVLKQVKCRRSGELPAKLVQLTWSDDNLKMECVGDAQDTIYADQMCAEMIMNWLAEEQKHSFKTAELKVYMKEQKQSERTMYRALDLLQEGDKPKIRKIKGKRGFYEINAYVDLSKFKKKPENDK